MNAVQCDQCQVFAANSPSPTRAVRGWPHELPDGWVSLSCGNYDRDQSPQIEGEFCGTKCAGKFLTAFVPRLVAKDRAA